MPIPPLLLIAAAFFAVLAALATKAVLALWRNEPGQWQSRPMWWRQSIAIFVVVGWAMLIGALAGQLAMSGSGAVGSISTAVLFLSLFVFVGGLLTAATAALFGWPRALIPPHLRDHDQASM
jgi:hypothetical protein